MAGGPTLSVAWELARAADDSPGAVFLRTREDQATYAACADRVRRMVTALRGERVDERAVVALLAGSSVDQVVVWFALSHLGARHAPLNAALSGDRLVHALRTASATLLVVDQQHAGVAHEAVTAGRLPTRVVTLESLVDSAAAADPDPRPPAPVEDLATATLLFTSGTTGASKACGLSHRYLVRQGQLHARAIGAGHDDVLFTPFPLFHIDGATLTVVAAMTVRATAALAPRFSASRFWEDVRHFGATVFNFMGATLTILWKQPPTPRDRDHRVRLAWGVPLPEWHRAFEDRFGLQLRTVYGLTDGGVPVYDPLTGPRRPTSAGRVLDAYEVRIDPDARRPGDPPEVGEILVRGREPGLTMNEYVGDPAATAATIVDGWVRTGDLGDLDAEGFLTFHGRLSDSIRRRGENISAFEVEQIAALEPRVLEVAALGVPSELTEEDVLVCVVPRPGSDLRPEDVRAHALAHGPAYMAPRYVRFVDALPKTPTEKVEKFRLRDEGITPDTWDADPTTRSREARPAPGPAPGTPARGD